MAFAAMTSPHYAIVAYLKDPVAVFVEQLRRDLHPTQAHLPAHVTILPPRLLHGSESDALELAEEVCSAAQPFNAALGGVENFFPITPTVFIRVAHAAYRMRELHDHLNSGPLASEEQWPYMPHLTLVRMDTLNEAEAAERTALRSWADYSGSRHITIDELTFVREAGPNRWSDLAPIPLGRRLAPTL
ncbi:MAG TPA: 2'-5' RNA ligase family protein [Terriglobales bacterium]|nr:2'-5' RNA ligase family protein [Terriglobales bacterium]